MVEQQPGGVSLSKITLTKSAPSISLSKGAGAGGQMRINLNWSQPAPAKGFLKRALGGASAVDLDLGCLWETTDGSKGVVQALGNAFGNLHQPPYVLLDGDDRSGTSTGGENLVVNLDRLDQIRRVLVFAYIYEGAPNWAAADGVVTLYPAGGAAPIEVRLDEPAADKRFCAIALLTNEGGSLGVRREVQYVAGWQPELDKAYGWGMNWTSASK
ncbi:Tellurium resistance [Nocardioides sp. ChNu-153]|uniref:TerD family protein n=1 Tax=unclassified Nocardioides TaxID=2615069 RepID=UPI002406B602|nr:MULTISPECIES: hypothetical protein [unclassified Nocardioides]MDF9717036.1 hypothetical protein [Nocardioides sp. ChNu-99]MDN7122252.1 Tellurium resistance [Nocardioides sp. ChNu-153]